MTIKNEVLEFFANPENDNMEVMREFDLSKGLLDVGPKIDRFIDDLFEAGKELKLQIETDVRYNYKEVDGKREFDKSQLFIVLSRTPSDVSKTEKE